MIVWRFVKNNILAIALICAVVVLLAIAATYLKTLSHVVFVADDYSYARRIQQYGFLGAQENWYLSWSEGFTGRVMSTLLISLSVTKGQQSVGMFLVIEVIVITLLLISSFIVLVKKILPDKGRMLKYLIAGYIAVLIFLSSVLIAPAPLQTTLWSAGINIYLLPPLIMTAGVAFIASSIKENSSLALSYAGLALVLFAGLCSETMSIVAILFGCYLYILTIRNINQNMLNETKRIQYLIRLLLALSTLAFLIQYSAPGTFVRRLYLTPSSSITETMLNSLQSTSTYMISTLILHWDIIILLIISGAICARLTKQNTVRHGHVSTNSVALQISKAYMTTLTLGAIVMLPVYMASGNIPERSLMIVGNIMIGVFLWAGFKLGATKWSGWLANKYVMVGLFLGVILITLVGYKSNHYYTRGIIEDYQLRSTGREKQIMDSQNAKVDTVALPDYYKLGEIDSDPKYWLNIEMAKYYKKTEIRSERVR